MTTPDCPLLASLTRWQGDVMAGAGSILPIDCGYALVVEMDSDGDIVLSLDEFEMPDFPPIDPELAELIEWLKKNADPADFADWTRKKLGIQ